MLPKGHEDQSQFPDEIITTNLLIRTCSVQLTQSFKSLDIFHSVQRKVTQKPKKSSQVRHDSYRTPNSKIFYWVYSAN